jgi:hypothetical protein
MPQTRTSCPRCRQPIMAEITQLFDTNIDPQARQKILSGQFNLANCPHCGFQGNLSTPLVYHDPEKELLLTFFPPELGLPVNEQEKLIGPLINQAVNKLPLEKRKAYILRPQTMFTMQGLIEKILEGDGITKEMIQDQEKKVALIRELMTTPEADRLSILEKQKELIDENFFSLFSRLIDSASASQDQNSMKQLAEIEKLLLDNTEIGKEVKKQAEEAEAAVKSLQEVSKTGFTREKLLDLLIEAPSDIRVATIVRMTRSGMDYSFFQILSERIEAAQNGAKEKLITLRESILKMVAEIDQEMKAQAAQMSQLIDKVVQSPDIPRVMEQILPAVNEVFIEVLKNQLEMANQKNDTARLAKLQLMVDVIQKASAPPPEYELIEKLLEAPDEDAMQKILGEKPELITQEFTQMLPGLINQAESQKENPEVVEKLRKINKLVLKISMQSNLAK